MIPTNSRSSLDGRIQSVRSLWYLLAGLIFGVTLVKGEIVSWFRIQEMFRFQSFHMYGVIGTAVLTGIVSVALLKRIGANTLAGERITIAPKRFAPGQIYGGVLFGIGWAITGACPGPLYALLGAGYWTVTVVFLAALLGTASAGYLAQGLTSRRTGIAEHPVARGYSPAEIQQSVIAEEMQEC